MNIDLHLAAEIVGLTVTVASLLANVVPPHTIVGKALHWLALNGGGIQRAVSTAAGEKK